MRLCVPCRASMPPDLLLTAAKRVLATPENTLSTFAAISVLIRSTERRADSQINKGVFFMPDKETIERAKRDKRQGKAPSTQAGEFVREEIEHVREGKHGVRSAKQAIA